MYAEPSIAEVASLIGDPARANMLSALKDDGALTATELAHIAGVAPQTASGHLSKLMEARLIAVERQGRHRYYRLAGHQVAEALEALALLSVGSATQPRRRGPRDQEVRFARTCYDHLAGRAGVAVTDALQACGLLRPADGDFCLTGPGETFCAGFGIDLVGLAKGRRLFARQCLDWSERRPHLAGALGAALLEQFVARGWILRHRGGRAVEVTEAGHAGLKEAFAVDLGAG
jgi:DNA-binding transcriptional ArsR family regulator